MGRLDLRDPIRDEDRNEDFELGRGCAPAADESRESGCTLSGCRGGDHGERALLSPCAPCSAGAQG